MLFEVVWNQSVASLPRLSIDQKHQINKFLTDIGHIYSYGIDSSMECPRYFAFIMSRSSAFAWL